MTRTPAPKLDQAKLDQAKLDQAKPDQAKLDQAKPDQVPALSPEARAEIQASLPEIPPLPPAPGAAPGAVPGAAPIDQVPNPYAKLTPIVVRLAVKLGAPNWTVPDAAQRELADALAACLLDVLPVQTDVGGPWARLAVAVGAIVSLNLDADGVRPLRKPEPVKELTGDEGRSVDGDGRREPDREDAPRQG